MQDGQEGCQGLAAAGGGAEEHVLAGGDEGPGLPLDRRGRTITPLEPVPDWIVRRHRRILAAGVAIISLPASVWKDLRSAGSRLRRSARAAPSQQARVEDEATLPAQLRDTARTLKERHQPPLRRLGKFELREARSFRSGNW
jgi:hypothetical protein